MQPIQTLRSEISAPRQRSANFAVAETCRSSPVATGAADIFESHRSRLFGVAYRMLRTRADAEDVLQDAYLRWHETTTNDIQSPIAFLVTVTTRLCVDSLRDLEKELEEDTGNWLPDANDEDYVASPEEQVDIGEE